MTKRARDTGDRSSELEAQNERRKLARNKECQGGSWLEPRMTKRKLARNTELQGGNWLETKDK